MTDSRTSYHNVDASHHPDTESADKEERKNCFLFYTLLPLVTTVRAHVEMMEYETQLDCKS